MEYKNGQTADMTPPGLEQIVAEHTGLVKSVALRLSYVYGEDPEDLIQIGYIGLIKAARRFEPERGLKFSTYAVPLIAIKVSRNLKSDAAAVRRAENQFMAETGRSPRISDLSKLTGFAPERVTQALQASDAMKNLEDFDKPDVMADPGLMTSEEEKIVTKMDITAVLNTLEPKARQVMVLRYYKDMTQTQVAQMLGISQVQVCRIEKKPLNIMSE